MRPAFIAQLHPDNSINDCSDLIPVEDGKTGLVQIQQRMNAAGSAHLQARRMVSASKANTAMGITAIRTAWRLLPRGLVAMTIPCALLLFWSFLGRPLLMEGGQPLLFQYPQTAGLTWAALESAVYLAAEALFVGHVFYWLLTATVPPMRQAWRPPRPAILFAVAMVPVGFIVAFMLKAAEAGALGLLIDAVEVGPDGNLNPWTRLIWTVATSTYWVWPLAGLAAPILAHWQFANVAPLRPVPARAYLPLFGFLVGLTVVTTLVQLGIETAMTRMFDANVEMGGPISILTWHILVVVEELLAFAFAAILLLMPLGAAMCVLMHRDGASDETIRSAANGLDG